MYYYIYDSFLADRKYDRVIAEVETRLTDFGISGKIGRLTPFTSARGLIRDEVKRGAQTVVVVGNDETVAEVIDGLGEAKVTLGIIPIGGPIEIARSLGIPEGPDACDVLSKRLTQKLDLGKVNGRFFLSQVHIPQGRVTIEGESSFRISALQADCEIVISNLGAYSGHEPEPNAPGNPQDGFLDAMIVPKGGGFWSMFRAKSDFTSSVFPLRKMSITSDEPMPITADGKKFMHNVASIEIVPDHLKVITGRMRVFA